MAFTVAATYHAKPGEEEEIRRILMIMGPLSRKEAGCLFYQAHRSPDDPRVFFLYEQYRDEAATRPTWIPSTLPNTSKATPSRGSSLASAPST
jgi:hypothetical protein